MSLAQRIKLDPTRDVVELPNGDLMYTDRDHERPDTVQGSIQSVAKGQKLAEQVASALSDPNHPDPQCPWCGQKPGDEAALRAHIVSRHSAAIGAGARDEAAAEEAGAARRGKLTPASVRAAVAKVVGGDS